jgi:hypothetical protein
VALIATSAASADSIRIGEPLGRLVSVRDNSIGTEQTKRIG